jgi:effector-binding domain-containing protein
MRSALPNSTGAPWRRRRANAYWRRVAVSAKLEAQSMKTSAGARGASALAALLLLATSWLIAPGEAQTTPSPTPVATPTLSPTPMPTTSTPDATPSPDSGASTGQTLDLTARPAAYVEAKANRDEVFSAITGSLAMIRGELDKAGLKPAGRPIAVFLEADDTGFTYRAEIPIDAIPEGKTQLSPTVKFGQTPASKAMRFEHRGAYDDIDATYEAITAYLDEKGVDVQDVFMEEYLNDVKTSDDPNLQVDIYVLIK